MGKALGESYGIFKHLVGQTEPKLVAGAAGDSWFCWCFELHGYFSLNFSLVVIACICGDVGMSTPAGICGCLGISGGNVGI